MPDMNRNVANPAGEDDLLATRHPAPRPGQDHFIADTDETGLGAVDAVAGMSFTARRLSFAYNPMQVVSTPAGYRQSVPVPGFCSPS